MNFTKNHRVAVLGGKLDAELRLRQHRMAQAETFCHGGDDAAVRYDNVVANDQRDVDCLDEVFQFLCEQEVAS